LLIFSLNQRKHASKSYLPSVSLSQQINLFVIQRNVVLIDRATRPSVKFNDEVEVGVDDSGERVDETMDRLNKEESKFHNFWVGVTSIVESYRYHIRKPEREHSTFVHSVQHEVVSFCGSWGLRSACDGCSNSFHFCYHSQEKIGFSTLLPIIEQLGIYYLLLSCFTPSL
jgi:hypothetical protein